MSTKIFNTIQTKTIRKTLRRTQTDAERKLWSRLRNKQFYGYKFYRQYGVGKYIADFYCPKLKLIVEADGGQHYEEKGELKDRKRDEYFALMHITVERFSNSDILKNIDDVLVQLSQKLPQPLFEQKRGIISKKRGINEQRYLCNRHRYGRGENLCFLRDSTLFEG